MECDLDWVVSFYSLFDDNNVDLDESDTESIEDAKSMVSKEMDLLNKGCAR